MGMIYLDTAVRLPTWVDEVVALYVRDSDMGADEFERLYDVALTGERPDHPSLPGFLPMSRCTGMSVGRELR